MNGIKKLFIFAILTLIQITSISAKSEKIGVVDLQKVIQCSNQIKEIQKKLENNFKEKRDKLIDMENNLRKNIEKFRRESILMNKSQKKELENRIIVLQQTFEREGQKYQRELNMVHNVEMNKLYKQIKKVIEQVALEKKYDIVLQKEIILYNKNDIDITKNIVDKMN